MNTRAKVILMCLGLCAVLLAGMPCLAQTGGIRGLVRTTAGQLCGEDEARAQIEGSTTTSRPYDYGRIYGDGIYQIPEAGTTHDGRSPNMLPGTYAVGMSDEYEWRPRNWSFVKVQNGALTTCNIKIIGTYEVRSQNGMTGVYANVGQTFVAKGGSLQRMTLWFVPTDIVITVHQGGPGGPQVGVSKSVPGNAPTVTWMYGEVPTVAGQTYYINFYSNSASFQTYRQSGNPYASGQAYYNGVAQGSTDLYMTLFEDCDGQASMYHVHLSGTETDNFSGIVGQTFKARGSNILSVGLRFRTGGAAETAVCTIHEGGPGGAQIGPSKATTAYDYSPMGQKVTFCWLPGEVPVTSGNTYYLRVATADGTLYAWCSKKGSMYPDGQAYEGDVAHGGDLIGTIMGEVSLGSSTCAITGTVKDANGTPVGGVVISANNGGYSETTAPDGTYSMKVTGDLYDLTCSKPGYTTQQVLGYNAACGASQVLNWTLPWPGGIVGYVKDIYLNGLVGATVTTSPGGYSVQTTAGGHYAIGCLPATYSVTASAKAYQTQTKTGIVVTQGNDTQCDFTLTPKTTLDNPGFEIADVIPTGWTEYGHGLNVRTGTGYGGITPHGGSRYAEKEASWTDPKKGGVYQTIWAPVGIPLTFTAWTACYGEGGGAAHTFSRIGLDDTGGTDPNSGSVKWSAWYNAPADNVWEWVQLWKTVTPTSNIVTVFLDYWQEGTGGTGAYKWQVNAFDDAALSASSLITLHEAKQVADGNYVYFGPAVVRAKFTDSPNFSYVEELDRTSGVRVNGDLVYAVGDKVNIGGPMGTDTGERYVTLSEAQILQVGYGGLDPIAMPNRSVGGGSHGIVPGITDGTGLNNIGLLITTWGRVTHIDLTHFYLDDGSGVILEVEVPSAGDRPPDGSYAVVTGVSSTYDAGGGDIGRLLRAKSGGVTSYD